MSWLSPRHPHAVISESAAHIREEMHMAEVDDEEEDEDDDEKESDMDDDGEVCFYKVMRILLHYWNKICVIRETELVNMTLAVWTFSLTRFQCKKSECAVNRIYNRNYFFLYLLH